MKMIEKKHKITTFLLILVALTSCFLAGCDDKKNKVDMNGVRNETTAVADSVHSGASETEENMDDHELPIIWD